MSEELSKDEIIKDLRARVVDLELRNYWQEWRTDITPEVFEHYGWMDRR